jgi:hypothetical protein
MAFDLTPFVPLSWKERGRVKIKEGGGPLGLLVWEVSNYEKELSVRCRHS